MVEDRKREESVTARRNREAAKAGDRGQGAQTREAQAFVLSAYGLQRQAGWSLPRAGARPINLERRARFARFDVV